MPVSTLIRIVPVWDIQLMAAFLSVEPAPEERIEHSIAQLTAMWVRSKQPEGTEPSPPSDFLMFRKAWDPLAELDPNDVGVMNALRNR